VITSDHLNPALWILDQRIERGSPTDSGSIDPIRGVTTATAIGVAVSSRDADPDWSLGGYLHCLVPMAIGSHSGLSFFNASLLLGCVTFVAHPAPDSPAPEIEWRLSFPRWIYSIDVEIWRYLAP
jgi:hypothetical protein